MHYLKLCQFIINKITNDLTPRDLRCNVSARSRSLSFDSGVSTFFCRFYYFNLFVSLFLFCYDCVTYYFVGIFINYNLLNVSTMNSIKFEIFKRKVILNTRLWKFD